MLCRVLVFFLNFNFKIEHMHTTAKMLDDIKQFTSYYILEPTAQCGNSYTATVNLMTQKERRS